MDPDGERDYGEWRARANRAVPTFRTIKGAPARQAYDAGVDPDSLHPAPADRVRAGECVLYQGRTWIVTDPTPGAVIARDRADSVLIPPEVIALHLDPDRARGRDRLRVLQRADAEHISRQIREHGSLRENDLDHNARQRALIAAVEEAWGTAHLLEGVSVKCVAGVNTVAGERPDAVVARVTPALQHALASNAENLTAESQRILHREVRNADGVLLVWT